MCNFFANLNVLLTWGPHMVYMGSPYGLHGVPIYILYLYDHMWLVGVEAIRTLMTIAFFKLFPD